MLTNLFYLVINCCADPDANVVMDGNGLTDDEVWVEMKQSNVIIYDNNPAWSGAQANEKGI